MKICNNNINFKSINNPIEPFKLKTNNGALYFEEINLNKEIEFNLLEKMGKFFLDNFAAQSSHPFWKKCRKSDSEYDYYTYHKYLYEVLIDDLKNMEGNPDATLLFGRRNKKIEAAIAVKPLNLNKSIQDNDVLYIDMLAVNKKYRNNYIGKNLINTIIETTKDRYTSCLLVAYKESVPFYKKIGFDFLQNKKLIENLANLRRDFPKFASFLTKTIK